jgi:DNA polymerase I-like protein with 3'-5' exonuclease and polymerase domains
MASRDESMLKLYAPGRPANDIYLFVASHIRGLGDRITQYYDPEHPTAESISLAKKHCKNDRAVAKIVVLACAYNAGPKKIHETLTLAGFQLPFYQVDLIHKEYWQLFDGVKKFEGTLVDEWRRNKGYIFNGFGRPLTVAEDLTKDLVNRYVQSTGHDFLMAFIAKIGELRLQRQVEMYPWIVDFHDETIWECPEKEVNSVKKLMEDALIETNCFVTSDIPLTGDVIIADNLADIKCSQE